MTDRHVAGDLGVYLAGAMGRREAWGVEQHLAVCGWCTNELRELREVTALFNGMPPELLLDGPPDGSDLLLRRTVRQVRREAGRRRRVVGWPRPWCWARSGSAAASTTASRRCRRPPRWPNRPARRPARE